MKRFLILVAILIQSVCSYSQIDTISLFEEARELQKHAKLYFWYATESHHQLKHYYKAKDFCNRSNSIITKNNLNSPKSQEILDINNIMLSNLEEIELINYDNINGRYPLFNEIMNISPHKVNIDNPLELSIEASIDLLGTQLKGSKSIFALTYFTVIESNYNDPGLIEVMRQAISEASSHYVISSHELVEIIGQNKTDFTNSDLFAISNSFNTSKLGVININLVDSIDNIYYNQCSFSEYNVSSNKKNQIAYAEAFKEDVVANSKDRITFFLFVFIFFLILFLSQKGWKRITWTHYFIASSVLSYFITFFLVLGLRAYELSGTEFYLETNAIIWRTLTAVIFSCLPLILVYIGIMRLKFLVEEVNKPQNIVAIIYGVCFSSIIFFSSLEIFENGYSSYLYNYSIVALILIIPSYTSGKIASRFLINNEKINIIPLGINLFAITYIFFILLLKNSIVDVLMSTIPVALLSVIPFNFNKIIKLFSKALKNHNIETVKDPFSHPIFIKPLSFDSEVHKICSDEILRVNVITGVIGTGKTRIIREIEKVYENADFYYGDCDKETSVIDYEPFVEAFKTSNLGSGIFEDQSAKAKMLEKGVLEKVVEKAGDGGQLVSALVSSSGETEMRDEKFIIQEITGYLKNKKDPVIIAIEDLNNIDKNSKGLLRNLIYEVGINYNEYNTISFLLTSTDGSDNDDNALDFLSELHANEIIESNILFKDLHKKYADFKGDLVKNLHIEYESEMKILDFLEDVAVNPLHYVETVKLIDTYKMFNHQGKLSLRDDADLDTLPKGQAASGIYQQEIEALDTELFNILECAAYIGKSFEADVIVHIINKDRLDILNRLREAERDGLILDKSDEDDIYEFTSRALMKEIRHFGIQKKGNKSDKNVSQIVKEYNDRVINYYYDLKGFDINKLDINLLISLAKRSFENNYYRKSYNKRCIELNEVAAERTYSSGKYNDALKMYDNLYELSNRFNLDEIKLNCLLIIVDCYLKIGKNKKAFNYKDELILVDCDNEKITTKDLLLARLYMIEEETKAFELLLELEKKQNLNYDQEMQVKLLLAEIYDNREEDKLAFDIYNKLLADVNLNKDIKMSVLSKLSDLHLQHGDVEKAQINASNGYKLALKQKNIPSQEEFLHELILISMRLCNYEDFEKYKLKIQKILKDSSMDIKGQMSILFTKFSLFTNGQLDHKDFNEIISRLLKMVRFNKDHHNESQLIIFQSIASILNNSISDAIVQLQDYLNSEDLDADIRIKNILILLYTDLAILQGNTDFSYFEEIDFSIIKEVPTLLPKYNLLHSLMKGGKLNENIDVFTKDIEGLNNYLLAEEFPFCLKLLDDTKKQDLILKRYFMLDKFKTFLNE